MTTAHKGDLVRIHYTGTLSDGTVFDTSEGRDPLEFRLGSGMIIDGMNKGIEGMSLGEVKIIDVAADDAYGPHDPDKLQSIEKAMFPEGIPLEQGTPLQVSTDDGQAIPVTIHEVREDDVIVDLNHPLAGRDLTFTVTLVGVGQE